MAALPDLDDLLDEIEGSVGTATQPLPPSRRGFFDPVPCFSPSCDRSRNRAAGNGNSSSSYRNAAEAEEKLSFLEFLKVTAKEAEELQRLHDDQQVNRGSKRVCAVEKKPDGSVVVTASPSVPSKPVEPDMPELPDVPDTPLLQLQGRSQAAQKNDGTHQPIMVLADDVVPEEAVEMVTEVEEDEEIPVKLSSPSIALYENAREDEMEQQQFGVDASIGDQIELTIDDDFDDVLAYLAKCERSVKKEEIGEDCAEEAESAPSEEKQTRVASTSPSDVLQNCETAASFDVVSYCAPPTEEMGQTEMEKELEEIARDFPDSDQPELARGEDLNVPGDETFYSTVESLQGSDRYDYSADSVADKKEEENEVEEANLVFIQKEQLLDAEDTKKESPLPSITMESEPQQKAATANDVSIMEEEEEHREMELVSPSISEESTASIEVLEKEEAVQGMRVDQDKKSSEEEERVDWENAAENTMECLEPKEFKPVYIGDTVAVLPHQNLDSSLPEIVVDVDEIMAESVLELAAIEEAGDSMAEEEESGELLAERNQQEKYFEVPVEGVPAEAAPAAAAASGRPARFHDRVIADVHEIDGDEAPAIPTRLTESELQLGKAPPVWISDGECPLCMLCSSKFTFLLRRHHCRACGRVLCAGCCNERMVLAYQPEKGKARVCSPCAVTLLRVEEFESRRNDGAPEVTGSETGDRGEGEGAAAGGRDAGSSGMPVGHEVGASSSRKKSILKVRSASVNDQSEAGSSAAMVVPGRGGGGVEESVAGSLVGSAPRGVVFRDGSKPGEHTADEQAREDEERGERRQHHLRKKSRKRAAVSRRVAALKVEEQMTSALPTSARPEVLILKNGTERWWCSVGEAESTLADGICLRVIVNRLLTVVIQLCQAPYGEGRVMCAVSNGFHALGLDEVVFCWRFDEEKEDDSEGVNRKKKVKLPIEVVRRIEEILQSCFSSPDLPDVRRVTTRMPRLHSSVISEGSHNLPLTPHTLLVAATFQCTRHLPLSLNRSYRFAVPVRSEELSWALAAPERVLIRIGLESGCYPTPLIIDFHRASVYSEETSSSVLKMFTDMTSWSYKMQSVAGGTVALSNEETVLKIPRYAKQQMRKIVEINKNMLAWLCETNVEADSHLVCMETECGLGPYETKMFQKGGERKKTGASFVIIDGALKSAETRVQVSVCEDGVAIRLPSEGLVELINAILDGKDHTMEGGVHRLKVLWVDDEQCNGSSQLTSPIDGRYLGNKMQYGVTLERAISCTIHSPTMAETATRLSHVFNMRENTISSEDEAKVFSVAELVASEAASMLDEYLPLLTSIEIDTIAIRVTVERDRIEYEVADWAGLERELTKFRASMDKLVPVFVNVLGYIPHGFSIELWMTIVNTTPLPIEI